MTIESKFVVCIRSEDYPASLECRKLYRLLPDPFAEAHGQVRIIDESGEDYLYPDELFAAVALPARLTRLLDAA